MEFVTTKRGVRALVYGGHKYVTNHRAMMEEFSEDAGKLRI